MLSIVIADYKARLKFKNILKILNVSFVPLIYTFLLPVWNRGIKNPLTYWGVLLGLLVSIIMSRLFPFELSQMMYLVPLTEKEKRNYLKTAYLFRCLSTTLFSIVLVSAGCLYEGSSIFMFSMMVINIILMNFTVNAALPYANKTDNKGRSMFYDNYTTKYTALLIFIALGSMLTPFFTFDDFKNVIVIRIVLIYQLIISICTILFIVRNWSMVMGNALKFEESTYVTEAKNWKR